MRKIFYVVAGLLIVSGRMSITAQQAVVDTTNVYELNEVVVSAVQARRETPVAFRNVSAAELRENNTGQSLPYLFTQTPSVVVTSDGGNGVGYVSMRVRGTDAGRINFTVDGVPVNDSESHSVFWVNMPDFASSVESIQIQRGAGTSTNGAAAFGATVAMQTQRPRLEPYFEASSAAGSYGTFAHTVRGGTGLIGNHFVFDARYSNVQTDGYIERARANMSSYYASAAYYNGGTMLKFQTFGSSEVSYQAWNGVDADTLRTNRRYNSCGKYTDENGVTRFYDNQTDNYWQHHYHLLATQRLSDNLNLNVTLHYTDGHGYYEDYKAGAKYAAYKLPNFKGADGKEQKRTDLVRRKWLQNDFYGALARLTYTRNRLQAVWGASINNYTGDHFGRVLWMKTVEAMPQPDYEYYRSRGEKLDYNTFLKASYRLSNALSAYADLQYRGIDYSITGTDDKAGAIDVHRTFSFFNPKAGLSYERGGSHAYASFAVAHREPNRKNFTENGPTAQPTYETLYDYEAGYEYTRRTFHLGANLYYMDYDNQLVLTGKISEIGEALTSNIKDSYRMGVELSGGLRLAPWLDWSGNVTLSSNKIRNFTEYVDTYDKDWNVLPQTVNELGTTDIAFSPNLTFGSTFDFHWRGFTAALMSSYVGRQYLDNTSALERSIDPYFLSDLRVGYAFHPSFMKEIALDLSVRNLFNAEYESGGWTYSSIQGGQRTSSGYFTQATRNFMARLTLKF